MNCFTKILLLFLPILHGIDANIDLCSIGEDECKIEKILVLQTGDNNVVFEGRNYFGFKEDEPTINIFSL